MRNVTATWHVTGHRNLPKITNVLLEDGYSDESDIPKIIALRYFDESWTDRIIVTATESDDESSDLYDEDLCDRHGVRECSSCALVDMIDRQDVAPPASFYI